MTSTLRIAFMGSPDFSVPVLTALIEAGHDVACVYCQPPRPAGRGQKDRACPVHRAADAAGLTVRTPRTLKSPEDQAAFAALDLDAAVVAAYGLILPAPILSAPRHGCINVHASLLPRWRGAAPIQRAILAGDDKTGVTIMQMDEGLDTGPMLLWEEVAIDATTTGESLHDALAALGARLIVDALDRLGAGTLEAVPQPEDGATYAAKLDKAEAALDFARDAASLERQVRAFAPWPGAWFALDGERIKVLKAETAPGSGPPGVILDDHLTIACGGGALRPLVVQRQGKRPMDVEALLRGLQIAPGTMVTT